MRRRAARVIPEDLRIARTQIPALEAAIRMIEECQARLPLPSAEELAHIRKASRTLTPETYRLGIYQGVILKLENSVEDLRTLYKHPEHLTELHLSATEIKQIEAAAEALGKRESHED